MGAMDLDDSISITSTVDDDDPDAVWEVKQILAEGQFQGETRYLIEWEGFPLHSATWEPKRQFQDGQDTLLKHWALTKEKQRQGTAPRFHIDEWRLAAITQVRDKYARHDMRNRERKRRGLETTRLEPTLEKCIAAIEAAAACQPKTGHVGDDSEPAFSSTSVTEEQRRERSSLDHLFSDDDPGPAPTATPITETQRWERSSLDRLFSDDESENDDGLSPDSPPDFCEATSQRHEAEASIPNTRQTSHRSTMVQDTEQLQKVFAGVAIKTPKASLSIGTVVSSVETSAGKAGLRTKALPNVMPMAVTDLGNGIIDIDNTNEAASVLFPSSSTVKKKSNPSQKKLGAGPGLANNGPGRPPAAGIEPGSLLQKARKPLKTIQSTSEENVSENVTREAYKSAKNNCNTSEETIETDKPLQTTGIPPITSNATPNKSNPKASNPPNSKRKRVSFVLSPAEDKHSDGVEASLFVANDPGMPDSPSEPISNPPQATPVQGQQALDESVPKTCVIGSMRLTCSFHVAAQPTQAQIIWYQRLMRLETLRFSHMCTAQDLLQQLRSGELTSSNWVGGTADSYLQSDKLVVLLDYLRSSSLGLLCHSDDVCLLLYPSTSADWQQSPLPTAPLQPEHPLGYITFEPGLNFQLDDLSLNFPQPRLSGISLFDKKLYHKILPSSDHLDQLPRSPDSIFLMFPPSATQEHDMFCQWLRVFSKNCEIRSSCMAGHWAKFLEGTRGAVIIHQDCMQSLHRIPNFAKLLHSRNEDYNFWVFRLPFFAPFSLPHPMDGQLDRIGIALDWAFPPGLAVMVTPSFFISQPLQAYNLLKWVWQNFSEEPKEPKIYRHGRLVVCHDIAEWLLSLSLEKSEANLNVRESKHILDVRMKTVLLVNKLQEEALATAVICAPAFIDGNDEQSLVNWFGWWSTSQVNQFRKFTVVCSDNDDDRRRSRLIKRPALRKLFAEDQFTDPAAHAAFTMVPSDSPSDLSIFLRSVSDEAHAGSWNPLVICPWAMYQHEGTSLFGDVTQWVKFFAEKYLSRAIGGEKQVPLLRNTQLGFFYMMEESANTGHSAKDKGIRNPWVAFVRPMELHRKPWRNAELLIWDYRLRDLSRQSQTISEADLSPPQRALIAEVTRQYTALNLPLSKVWAGGFKTSKMYTNPLDITLDWMSAVIANIKSWLPLKHDDLLNRGWSFVRSQGSQSMTGSPLSTRSITGRLEEVEPAVQTEKPRMVFYPPTGNLAGITSACPNRLHQWATSAQVEKESEYTFAPTLEWYSRQQEVGRGFEHIRMWSWKRIFEHYKIDDPEY
ncbi:hypothetical protein NQ176_g1019 [Zarea fungicola]|uniref:Uncharacterized protein n=1 Tax=Zarea fungicola TaxID=93591 RepID=A0ACC1NUF0_9HYPO|nr:hypothetical protein NQ176_g1019 [Lecanicillium fungicola]